MVTIDGKDGDGGRCVDMGYMDGMQIERMDEVFYKLGKQL